MTAERLASPRKIAVLHAKALGDFIVTLPALSAIKQTYPEAEIVLLTNAWVKEFLAGRPSPVNRVIVLPSLPGVNDTIELKAQPQKVGKARAEPAELQHFYKTMNAEKFDAAIHMQGDSQAASQFIQRLGARLTAGLHVAPAEPLDRSIPYVHYQNEILRNLEIAGLIGATTADLEPHIETTIKDEREIADVLESFGGEPFIVLHPGANDKRRMWPPVKFAAVADAFTERGYQVVLTGTPKEKPLITEIIQYMQRTALAQTSLSLGGLASLLARSSLVISNDTGPLHLARAVGTSTVGIFWMPNLLNWGPLTRARHRTAIAWELTCPKCGIKPISPWPFLPEAPDCIHPHSFVESVHISEVISLATELLGSAKPIPT